MLAITLYGGMKWLSNVCVVIAYDEDGVAVWKGAGSGVLIGSYTRKEKMSKPVQHLLSQVS